MRYKIGITNQDTTKKLKQLDITLTHAKLQTFERHLDEVKVTLFGPRVDGSYILRIEGKPNGQSHKVKGHVELNVKSGDLHRVLAEQKLYDDIAALKLAHFVGYIVENHVVKAAKDGTLLNRIFCRDSSKNIKNGRAVPINKLSDKDGNGKELNVFYGKNIDTSQVFSLQKSNGHGIDLICKIDKPPPYWITIETKTVMRKQFDDERILVGGSLSKAQKEPIINLRKHMDNAENKFYKKMITI
ncbi:hypothetical protein [Providencia sneebia]|uniref:Uncharacterized protein n=1 Tax=Providencia sneebia DSM 19967 TaxID=1141660 RepID=K8WHE3_9GAMM|nr:hypothetical protein [Providencia sneebia]EKT59361.1 hypothetical protein OO7_05249 [Providencia sneebia DSM 19967]